jgi:hypothetical protein
MATHLRFLVGDHELDKTEALEYPVLVAGDTVCRCFESDKEFLEWAKETKYADKTAEVSRLISKFPRVEADSKDQERQIRAMAYERIRKLEELSTNIGVPTWSEELFVRAIEAGVLHSSLIYRHINLGGDFRPIVSGIPVPSFWWIGFDDAASSALVSGVLLLCSRSFFRGDRLWLYGAPAVKWNLTDFGFNDRASSGVAYS